MNFQAATTPTDASHLNSRTPLAFCAAVLVATILTALLPFTSVRWSSDDSYVLHNLYSDQWRHWLFPFNVDRPSAAVGAWWEGTVYQRRFLRLVPSALMAIEVRSLGQDPRILHQVSL